jgi:membrane protease YdiL (CAAX protease family)
VTRPASHRALTLATLLVALAVPEFFAVVPGNPLLLHIAYLLCLVPVIWVALRLDGLRFHSIGVRWPTWSSVLWGLALWAFGTFVMPTFTAALLPWFGTQGMQAGLEELADMSYGLRVFVAITSGIVEELLYRGFAIHRLNALLGRPWLAGVIAALIFGLAHVPTWGLGFALAADLPMGIYMTAFYMWRRDLPANMMAHSLGLLVAMFTMVP